jgi:hypothetical protein
VWDGPRDEVGKRLSYEIELHCDPINCNLLGEMSGSYSGLRLRVELASNEAIGE